MIVAQDQLTFWTDFHFLSFENEGRFAFDSGVSAMMRA